MRFFNLCATRCLNLDKGYLIYFLSNEVETVSWEDGFDEGEVYFNGYDFIGNEDLVVSWTVGDDGSEVV